MRVCARACTVVVLASFLVSGVSGCQSAKPSAGPTTAKGAGGSGASCTEVGDSATTRVHFQLPAGFTKAEGKGFDGASHELGHWQHAERTVHSSSVSAYEWTGRESTPDSRVLSDAISTFSLAVTQRVSQDPNEQPGLAVSHADIGGRKALVATWTQLEKPTAQDPKHTFMWWLVPADKTRFVVAAHAPAGTQAQALEKQIGSSLATGSCGT